MTTLLGNVTVAGQIHATQRNTVEGWLQLADRRQVIALQLTGNVPDHLLGLQVEFHSSDFIDWEADEENIVPRKEQESSLDAHQIGPLYDFGFQGDMTSYEGGALELAGVPIWLDWGRTARASEDRIGRCLRKGRFARSARYR